MIIYPATGRKHTDSLDSDPGRAEESLAGLAKRIKGGNWPDLSGEEAAQDLLSLDRALRLLLAERRDWLERGPGLDWPLSTLAALAPALEKAEARGRYAPAQNAARLYSALLPFPGNLRRLAQLEAEEPGNPLVQEIRARERAKLEAKVRDKGGKAYKPHNLCQVLKPFAGKREKGVIRLHTLPYALPQSLLEDLSGRYVLFMEPPMGTVFRHLWLRRFTRLADPALIGVAGPQDIDWLASQPGLVPVPLAHGHFLREKPPEPERPKRHDIVFNSAFNDLPRKRHALMLGLMRDPELAGATVLFLGYGGQEHVEEFKALVQREGLAGRAEIKANVPRAEVPRELAACRMAVHLSQVENAPRAVPEFLRQDLPCVISRLTSGVDFSMFNAATGAAVPDADLPRTIRRVLDTAHAYNPARWFRHFTGSALNSRRLNEHLKDHFKKCGYVWSADICAITSSGAHRYADPGMIERFAPDYAWIRDRLKNSDLPFGIT